MSNTDSNREGAVSWLRRIWSPTDYADTLRKCREHHDKWADLPAMAAPDGVEAPEFDGDMAYLNELADCILSGDGPVASPPPDLIWQQTIDATAIKPLDHVWVDHGQLLIDAWKAAA